MLEHCARHAAKYRLTKTTKGKITSLIQDPLCGTYLHPGQFSMEIPGQFSAEIYTLSIPALSCAARV